MKTHLFAVIITLFLLPLSLFAETNTVKTASNEKTQLAVADIFQDHMVLQRELPVNVWGKAQADAKISLTFAKQTKTTQADNNGDWQLTLSPLTASFIPETMSITSSKSQKKVVLKDILVGEVWICSGQSNMQMLINSVRETKALRTTAKNIRSFYVPNTVALKEQESVGGSWEVKPPNSAVAFGFAYNLEKKLNVPVGVILSSWGSSSLEAWMPRDMTKTLPYFSTVMDEFDHDEKRLSRLRSILSGPRPWPKRDDVYLRRQPNILYNAMIKPIAPFTSRGLVWYQGERNAKTMHGLQAKPWFNMTSGIIKYKPALQAWIKRYRQEWHNNEMEFMVVMLPRYGQMLDTTPTEDVEHPSAHSWAWMRESQIGATALDNVEIINTIDLGHVKNIHPKDKYPIGQRLALVAAEKRLKENTITQGPILNKTIVSANKISVHFQNNQGLTTTNDQAPSAFWLADENKNWQPAKAQIVNNTIELTSRTIKKPLYVRYAFAAFPQVNLINSSGLPAQPFRTDSFKP
jgi:sialate O-acetylesterase